MLRIGEGYDIHRLVQGGPLRLACVDIPADCSAIGHSDADAVAHAVCDALLGALALGDMGTYFPSADQKWKGVCSGEFLCAVARQLAARHAEVVNVDITVVLERPRLREHISAMREAVARPLGIAGDAVSIKAKTAEGLGAVGEGRAIEARAVALILIAD